jgi:hypothetical protein
MRQSMTVTGRRTVIVLLAAAALAAPAVLLRVLCVGRACDMPSAAQAPVPFCSLPPGLRDQVEAGFRDGRSPDLLAVTGSTAVAGSTGLTGEDPPPAWPSTSRPAPEAVPIAFWGTGVEPGAIEGSPTLADVAPTIAALAGLDRPHPGVRSGTQIPGVAGAPGHPRLVLEILLKGTGSNDLRAEPAGDWPTLRRLMDEGAATFGATAGSLPLDPAAQVATLGTGGLPREHGITGTLVRNDNGRLVRAWGKAAPFSVIATLGDDLDERGGERPLIGLVGTDVTDRGAIGGNWYVDNDRDDVAIGTWSATAQAGVAERLLARGYGADEVTDLLVVATEDALPRADRALASLVDAARRAADGSLTVVMAATGSDEAAHAIPAASVERRVEDSVGSEVVEATAVGGLFLDQKVLARAGLAKDVALRALLDLRAGGRPLMADAFPAIAVSLVRYC